MRRLERCAYLVLAHAAFALAGCDTPAPSWDLERMMDQPKFLPYAASDFFEDGRAMRTPPAAAVSREGADGPPLLVHGEDEWGYAKEIPIPATRELMDRGRDRFDIFCAPCHGVRGDGESAVAARMELRRPPSLIGPGADTLPPGRIFVVISRGYGLMRNYDYDLSVSDRWAIVTYLRALRLSQSAQIDALPSPVRERVLGGLSK